MRWHPHFQRHRYFYYAAVLGAGVWVCAKQFVPSLALPLAGDSFFGSYVALILAFTMRNSATTLRDQAQIADEGVTVIGLATLAAIAFSLFSIFALLQDHPRDGFRLFLSILSAPLGWLMLHTLAAIHYAHQFYAGETAHKPRTGGLAFPDCGEPTAWDFLYFSFVVGMTAQVSDIQVTSTPLRKLVLAHSIVSFFFNTVLLALAVNVVVTLAGQTSG